MPVSSPRSGGTPDAMAMPLQSGITTRNTTKDAATSRASQLRMGYSAATGSAALAVPPRGATAAGGNLVVQRREQAGVAVIRQHRAVLQLEQPAVQRQLAGRDPCGHGQVLRR